MPELDITAHIKAIEGLKCALLSDMASLYESMRKPTRREDQDEPLTGLLISLYRLARQLGVDYAELDELAAERLRAGLLDKNRATDERALIKHLQRREPI